MEKYKKIIDFIHGIYGTNDFVPLHAPCFCGKEKEYLNDCIDTTYVSSVGKYVDRFEQMVAEYTGAAAAVVCVNGTNALYMSMKLVGVARNDEVLTQALTFIATCNAISYHEAYPVFIDVDLDTLGMSPKALRNWLERNAELRAGACYDKMTGRRVKACVPMHTFGHPCRIDEIACICQEYGIELVEDAAESIGSLYNGKHTGTFGKVGAISFNGNKTITTGGGGMMLFQDVEMAKHAKHLTTQAKIPHRWEFVHDEIGYNYRMPNINAAIGCAQMESLDDFVKNKRATAKIYSDFFCQEYQDVQFVAEPVSAYSNYWLNAILLPNKDEQQRFLEYSNDNGVMTRPVWQLMNRLSMFKDCQNDGLKNTMYLADRIVNIPSSVRKNISYDRF